MANDFDRNQILGAAAKDYGFDKVLRGYDIKQVDDYISKLLETNKNAGELFDTRFNDLKNENDMLSCELEQVKGELKKMTALFESCQKERDSLKAEMLVPSRSAQQDAEFEELKEKAEKLVSKNRLLNEENKKLELKNADLQRDVAHLTKKVDKNRTEIKSLNEQVESGLSSDESKKMLEASKVYEGAIDKIEDLIYRIQTECSLAHSKAEDIKNQED